MIPKVFVFFYVITLLFIVNQDQQVLCQTNPNASSNILNSSFINSGFLKGVGTVVSKVTSPLRGAAGTVIQKVGGAIPGRVGLVGNCLGVNEWTDPYIGVVKRDGLKYCDANCGRIVSGFLCCIPQKPEDIDVKFHVFRRERDHTPDTLTWKDVNERWDYLDNPTKVVIATHGYLERANPGTWIYDLKNGWLRRDASHVILVDWKKGNRVNYFQAASNVRVIGMMIGQLILRNNIADKTLAVGFSLGAQIIGEAGKFVKAGGAENLPDTTIDAPISRSETSENDERRNSSDFSSSFDGESRNSGSRRISSGSQNERDQDSPQNRDSLIHLNRPQVKNQRQGKQMIKECHGLDPAGPFFDGCQDDLVLDKSDCRLVQIIHTSASKKWNRVVGVLESDFGSWKKSGHCDYWVNCGRGPQPECIVKNFGDFLKGALGVESNETVKDSTVSCSHGRAPEIYNAELNNTCNFRALDCPNCVEDTNCTGFADSMFQDQSTQYFGFMMDSKCSPNDDKNYFVRTSGGATLCDFSNDRRPNQNTNRNNNEGNQNNNNQNNNRDLSTTRGYRSTTRSPSRRTTDYEDEFSQPNNNRNSNRDQNRDRSTTRGYRSTTRSPGRRTTEDYEDEFPQPNNNRNNNRNRRPDNQRDNRNDDRNGEDPNRNRDDRNNNDSSNNNKSDRDSDRTFNFGEEESRRQSQGGRRNDDNFDDRRSDSRRTTTNDGFSSSEGRSGFFPLINLW